MGEQLAAGNRNLALLANSLATGFALVALIIALGPRSGAHFNPVITLAFALRGEFAKRDIAPYIVAQLGGALLGVLAAHAMFDLPLIQESAAVRSGTGQWWSEVVATCGLVFVVLSCEPQRAWTPPLAVGAYIAAAYWFTASTSFANPAVTLARALSATFSGIRPLDVAPFVLAQAVGMGLALMADRVLRR